MPETFSTTRAAEISRQRLCEQVAGRIEEDIINGHLSPGDELPSERVLVAQFGVSRTAIREAINTLSTKGLIRVMQGKRATVAPKEDWNVLDIGLLNGLSHSLLELLELRKILEVETAGLAAERATDEHLQAMAEAIQRYEEASNDIETRVQADIDFHAAIVKASGNSLLTVILEPVGELLRSSRRATLGAPGGREKSRVAHRKIWEALRTRDSFGARKAIRQHLAEVEEDFRAVGIV
jgi:GntR family transcriptional repressor for pyruvate dehydrogenase complex